MTAVIPAAPLVSAVEPHGTAPEMSWHEANRQYLFAVLDELRLRTELALRGEDAGSSDSSALVAVRRSAERAAQMLSGRTALATLVELFELSSFERDVLLLAASARLSARAGDQRDGSARSIPIEPSFELALRTSTSPFWAALSPSAPLRRYRLVELERPEDALQSPLRLDERVLFFLLGVPSVDRRLDGVLEQVLPTDQPLPKAYDRLAAALTAVWRSSPRSIVQLCGADADGKQAVAARGCAAAGWRLYGLRAADAHCDLSLRSQFTRLLDRELLLAGAALLLTVDEDDAEDARVVRWLLPRLTSPVLIARREPLPNLPRPDVRLDFQPLEPEDQRQVWRSSLGVGAEQDGEVDQLLGHFCLTPSAIRGASAAVTHRSQDDQLWSELWRTCRQRGRSRLSQLAQRIESHATWDHLVLPPAQKQVLQQMTAQLAHRTLVHERWGFRRRGARGLGVTAMFCGDSGTGKTMAAEVIANQLRLDLWRVDLSQIFDKYVGETEKNLRRIFDAADDSGAILLFDEADALFSKRTEAKDSMDRFTNVEVGYLLQRMESYAGLAILTTNLRAAIDPAFMRRLRFVVQFPFPKAEQRAEIWRRTFPAGSPTSGIEMSRLAQLNVAGGSIRNIALNAAFLAAAERSAIGMQHLLQAARGECTKLERTLTDAEVIGWT